MNDGIQFNHEMKLDDDELAHYGRLGMKWGRHIYGKIKESGRKAVGKVLGRSDSSESSGSNNAAKTKGQFTKADGKLNGTGQKAEREARLAKKKEVLESRSAKVLYENANLFTYKELDDAYKRLTLEQNIKNLTPAEVSKGEQFVDKTIKWTKKASDLADSSYKLIDNGTKAWNAYAKIHNALSDGSEDEKLPIIDNGKNGKNGKNGNGSDGSNNANETNKKSSLGDKLWDSAKKAMSGENSNAQTNQNNGSNNAQTNQNKGSNNQQNKPANNHDNIPEAKFTKVTSVNDQQVSKYAEAGMRYLGGHVSTTIASNGYSMKTAYDTAKTTKKSTRSSSKSGTYNKAKDGDLMEVTKDLVSRKTERAKDSLRKVDREHNPIRRADYKARVRDANEHYKKMLDSSWWKKQVSNLPGRVGDEIVDHEVYDKAYNELDRKLRKVITEQYFGENS